jgi:hypothetical protein
LRSSSSPPKLNSDEANLEREGFDVSLGDSSIGFLRDILVLHARLFLIDQLTDPEGFRSSSTSPNRLWTSSD